MSVQDLTKDNFETTIGENEIVIIDFWAEWCGPCKAFKPIFHAAADRHEDVAFVSCDTEAETELAGMFRVQSIPTTVPGKKDAHGPSTCAPVPKAGRWNPRSLCL